MHDQLRLCNQLCFPLYTISKEITRRYTPFLQELDLTYPQYLVMLVLWESDAMSVGEIGEQLHLDSGTLTPLLKRLQSKGLIDRVRCVNDERSVKITLTEQGQAMENQAVAIPYKMAEQLNLSDDEVDTLKKIVSKLNS
ncbi:MarR family transcriptional regulator [Moraxella sp. K127]|uniref:MarR family transcriptional regulator n=2 Tax=Moraxellaceae TaxID=468 RepID=A0A1B8Q872_MORLA|nr:MULTISPECIES: MarR family transcriptional regulator [Moraxella]MBE9579481.1 MarR family transcriptional regulator [Moraxella sp. K1664]MBE9588846.1 MarR family transcriptional regulator [Moraxella sp. K1630]MBE9589636.1 MarR family transcriptional regulator [Moraxella sp. K127]MBE9597058.1 MarR family transcriptional regulator [Moraxella sp. K2450]MDH9219637.1 MarR family transcriptional regulator [Moraxella lacunata]